LSRYAAIAFPSVLLAVAGIALLGAGCETTPTEPSCSGHETRAEAIPADAVKQTPETDLYPVVVSSVEFEDAIPLPGPVNTAGVEDACVISRDGNTMFIFFTPDAQVPAEEQLFDCVTGVWWCTRDGRGWTEPERAFLSDDLALDGPMAEQDGTFWFASYRTGGYRECDIYTATRNGSSWSWQNAGAQLNRDYEIGECYLTAHGDTMVYARGASYGIYGEYDLWESYRNGGGWTEPLNLGPTVNSLTYDGWPYLSANGNELWFTSFGSELGYPGPCIYRTVRTERGWSEPEEIVSHYVGDAAMDPDGNLYFTHHYIDEGGATIETDIYVCYRR
jgi:hypothetical protein